MEKKRLTGYSVCEVQEGTLLTFSYSVINEAGEILKRNETKSIIVMDTNMEKELKDVQDYIRNNYLK
ncbi:MAG: hypothetical protein ACRCVJ_13015 [Clostridium sp.]|uniref:hypothetical protein n=1 Tax=Clostridium sp. TaxID=1506 RepID=UPI003F361CA2